MKHHATGRKFGRKTNVRKALMNSLACSLIKHEKITTTEAKAKELRPYVEKLVTTARPATVAARRLVNSRLGGNQETLTKKLVDTISARYSDRPGGYTRITKLPPRQGDAAPMAVIEFV